MTVSSLTILVSGAPMCSQAAYSALQFCRAALQQGLTIKQVFFYQDGVFSANRFIEPLADEFNVVDSWVDFAEQTNTELVVCVSASERRGVVDSANSNLHPSFCISGLATFFDAAMTSDRTVTFK